MRVNEKLPCLEDHYLVRVPKIEKGNLTWDDEWLKPEPVRKKVAPVPIDHKQAEKIVQMKLVHQETWEIGSFHFPDPVKDGDERPYYPRIVLWVDHNSHLILDYHLAKPTEYRSQFNEKFLELCQRLNYLPEEILVRDEETFRLLKPVASSLGITLKRVKRLSGVEDIRKHMHRFAT